MRIDGRKNDQIRPIVLTPNVTKYAEGCVMVEFGETRVLCTASIDSGVPKWLQGTEKGWISAEYGMLPRSTHDRIRRDKAANSGRTQEISRLIGRSLRSMVNLYDLGERQIMVDCDVLQADGGTRTAAISGGAAALTMALNHLVKKGELKKLPINHMVSAVSVGVAEQGLLLDLCYVEDSEAETDMNFVMADNGEFVEIQGTAEGKTFSQKDLSGLIELANKGCQEIFKQQRELFKNAGIEINS